MKDLTLWLPESHRNHLTESDIKLHERWAAEQFTTDVPEKIDGGQIAFHKLPGNGNSNEAVLVLLPFANEYSEAMHIRASTLKESAPDMPQVYVFPNNTHKERYYSFDNTGCYDATPATEILAKKILDTTARNGIEKIALVGYSQGASVGAEVLRLAARYDVDATGGAMLAEPANVVERTAKELRKAFIATGLRKLNKAKNDSAIPALSKADHTRGGFDSFLQLLTLPGIAGAASMPENKALHGAMTHNTFFEALENIQDPYIRNSLTVVAMEKSKIVPKGTFQNHDWSVFGKPYIEEVSDYGHEGGDNVILHTLLARKALQAAGFIES